MTDETDHTDDALDSVSVYSDDIVETLTALEAEFNDVINEVNTIHQHHETIVEKLQWISEQPAPQSGIYVMQEEKRDLFEVIHELHEESLLTMEKTGRSTFCESLLQWIDSAVLVSL